MTGFCIETWHFSSSIMLVTMWNRIVGPRSMTGLIHDNSVTMKWARQHHEFFVEVNVSSGNSVVTTEQLFFTHFSIHHDYIPGLNAIKAHAQNLEKRFSLQKKTSRHSFYDMDTKKCWSMGSTKCSAGRHYTSLHNLSKVYRLLNKILILILSKLQFFQNELTAHRKLQVFFWRISWTHEWWCCYQHYRNGKPHFHLSQYVNKEISH